MIHYVQTGCLIAGILCLFYYFIILIYAGITADFAWIWLAFDAVFLSVCGGAAYLEAHPDSLARGAAAVCTVLLAAGLAVFLAVGCRVIAAMRKRPQAGVGYVIVLGAQVRGSAPSRALRRRLESAAAYAAWNPSAVLVLSGGQGSGEEISEALCMYRYLSERGISANRLVMEDRSTSTWENLKFSSELLPLKEKKTAVLSNNFHIYRALRIAKKIGYRDVSGIPAPSDCVMQPHYVVREIFAVMAGTVRGQL